jgi:DtxR family Mn-dependent transcriptional regulator
MSVSELSTSAQNYLKAVWSLGEWSEEPVTVSAIAERVGVRLSSVSDAMRKLGEQGLVEHTRYGTITLSGPGREHALAMVRRHRLIETFLVTDLGYGWEEVHDEAEQLEHAVSDLLVERLDAHLGHPERDPHGDPIPRADGTVVRPDAHLLSALPAGARVRVERISDADPRLLSFCAAQGIVVGALLEVREGPEFSDALEVAVEGAGDAVPLGRSATDAIWASEAPVGA